MNAAYVHLQQADFDLALRDLGRATPYFRQTDHPAFLGACYLNRAEIYHQLNLHQEVLELTEAAAPLFQSEGLAFDGALALSQGALSSLALGDLKGAATKIRSASRLFKQEQNLPRVA
jgi:tetratricopeptide (TPR) repeat protein